MKLDVQYFVACDGFLNLQRTARSIDLCRRNPQNPGAVASDFILFDVYIGSPGTFNPKAGTGLSMFFLIESTWR